MNQDSRQNDHLANERTFLAWMRTAIATMGFGIVIARLRTAEPAPKDFSLLAEAPYLGVLFVLVGLLAVGISTQRFLTVSRQIKEGSYEPDNRSVLLVAIVLGLLGLIILFSLLV